MTEPAPDDPSGSSRPRKSLARSRRLWSIGRELIIVFVGVWLALAAETWRDRRMTERRTENLVRAIQADMNDLSHWYEGWRDTVDADLAAWQRARASGEEIAPYYVRIPGGEHGPLVGWQVALASGALDVLDPAIVFELGRVSREVDGVGIRFARYMAQTEVLIYPRLQNGPAVFYEDGRLKPEYAAHIELLEELLAEMDEKMAWLKRLSERIGTSDGA